MLDTLRNPVASLSHFCKNRPRGRLNSESFYGRSSSIHKEQCMSDNSAFTFPGMQSELCLTCFNHAECLALIQTILYEIRWSFIRLICWLFCLSLAPFFLVTSFRLSLSALYASLLPKGCSFWWKIFILILYVCTCLFFSFFVFVSEYSMLRLVV